MNRHDAFAIKKQTNKTQRIKLENQKSYIDKFQYFK